VLIGDVEEGKVYEPVITNFYGMPFLRYRQGDLVRLVRIDGKENSVPRMTFVGRADDTIDMFGIARLNTEVVSQALKQSGLTQGEWVLRKEFNQGRVILRLYIELDSRTDLAAVEQRVSRELKVVDRHWGEAVYTIGYNPIKIKALPPGTFCRLGNDHGRVHMNPPDSMIQEIDHMGEGES
jgi:phenylacetate-coenzyme A ligase PaaK-like adenylate-forming protein